MERFVVTLAIAGAVISFTTFFFIYIIAVRQKEVTDSSKLVLRIIIGGITFGLGCASAALMLETERLVGVTIFGIVGSVFGAYIIFSRWLRYELHVKRILPYILRKAQEIVDKLEVPPNNDDSQIDGVNATAGELDKQKRWYILAGSATFFSLLMAITCAASAAIGGGANAALWGAVLGAISGILLWATVWIIDSYK